jgi:hypothetical protein
MTARGPVREQRSLDRFPFNKSWQFTWRQGFDSRQGESASAPKSALGLIQSHAVGTGGLLCMIKRSQLETGRLPSRSADV